MNEDEKAIDALTVRILALRQPVACDLRLLAMALKLVTDLERIGDEAVNIAERAEDGPLAADPETFADLDRMGDEAQRMVASALEAFLEGDDVDRAREVLLRRRHRRQSSMGRRCGGMEEYMKAPIPPEVPSALCVMSVAKYLGERVADHATNVAEEVIFMVRMATTSGTRSPSARCARSGELSARPARTAGLRRRLTKAVPCQPERRLALMAG